MTSPILLFLFLTHLASPLPPVSTHEDYDGDGLVGNKDRYPFIANPPKLAWEIKNMIFTWDIDVTKKKGLTSQRGRNYLTRTSFSFGGTQSRGFGAQVKAVIKVNPLNIFGDSGVRVKGGVHFAGHSKWNQADKKEMFRCLQAFSFQKNYIKRPHWEITVWLKNRSRETIVVKNLQVPLLDAEGNVITYAIPYTPFQKKYLKIYAGRRVPIRFRAEMNTGKALQGLGKIRTHLPIFGLANSLGTIYFQGSEKTDLLGNIQRMHQKTVPVKFVYRGHQVIWRVAKKKAMGQPMAVKDALVMIDQRFKRATNKKLVHIEKGKVTSIAGFPNTQKHFWRVSIGGEVTSSYLNKVIQEKIIFEYVRRKKLVKRKKKSKNLPQRLQTRQALKPMKRKQKSKTSRTSQRCCKVKKCGFFIKTSCSICCMSGKNPYCGCRFKVVGKFPVCECR